MERGFLSLLTAGKSALVDEDFSPAANSDEASLNRSMSFQPLTYEKSMISMLHYPYGSSFDIFDGDFRSKKMIGEWSKEDSKWRSTEREEKLKRLKNEPSIHPISYSPTIVFGQLPELQSMEQLNHDQERRRLKQSLFSPLATTTASPQILEPTLTNLQLIRSNYFTPAPLQRIQPPFPSPAKLSTGEQARSRRNTLSDKTRSLQKVLPWDKKMDMATIYEETYKYIKFLQAQIAVLESMPVASPTTTTTSSSSSSSSNFGSENPRFCNLYGVLGKLNRQQLLEVLVNSSAAQTILYSKGCCIYSLEQLILFKDIAEKNFFFSDPLNLSFSSYRHE